MTEYFNDKKILCSIYKSPRKEEMYIYVKKDDKLKKIPEALLKQFGAPEHVMDLVLTSEKKLARVEVSSVMENIVEKGFYLQMPPVLQSDVISFKDNASNGTDHSNG